MSIGGRIVKWMADKGYGFIESDDGIHDIFLHYSQVKNNSWPNNGDYVRFDIQHDYHTHKPRAVNVYIGGGGGGGGGGGKGYRDHYHQHQHRNYDDHDQALSKREEEEILIEFGKLLADGNAKAEQIHSKYQKDGKTEAFEQAAAQLVRSGAGKKRNDKSASHEGGGGAGGQKKKNSKDTDEERVLIEFGKLLDEGDEKAKEIHEAFTESKKYDEFVKNATELVG